MTREDWEVVKLWDVCHFEYGKWLPERSRISGNFNVYWSWWIVWTHNNFIVKWPWIIVWRKGSIWKVFYEKNDFFPIDTVFYITHEKEKIDQVYLYFLLWRLNLENMNGDAAVPWLNRNTAMWIEISLPPLAEQQRIASILSAYDDLIANNTRRIALLEQMAQTLYRQWFVEYKFPWYQDVEMVESGAESGTIPQGWEVKKIGEVVENFDNQRKPLSTMVRLNRQWKYPYYGAAKVIDYIDDYIFDWKYLLLAEDWSVITTGWKPVLQYVEERFWVSNHAHILRWKWISTNFLYIFFSQVDIWPYITWAAQPKISQWNLNRIPILIPSRDILDKFDNNIWSIIEDVFSLQKQNQSLKEQRDILLRKLIG